MAVSRQPKPAETAPTAVPETKRRVVRVWYEDNTFDVVNPNRPKLLLVFEVEHGKETPETVRENMWLIWHALGRPAASLDDWIETVAEVEWLDVERGKAAS